MGITNNVIYLIMCHLVGDYTLQNDFIAKTKGSNWYHLVVHCALYSLPFMVVFGIDWRLAAIFIAHMIIDPLKARWSKISYVQDQVLHYIVAILLYGGW